MLSAMLATPVAEVDEGEHPMLTGALQDGVPGRVPDPDRHRDREDLDDRDAPAIAGAFFGPSHAWISGSASRISAAAIGTTITSDSRVPCSRICCRRCFCCDASLSTMTGKSTPFNWFVSRCVPVMIRSAGAHTRDRRAARGTRRSRARSSW